MRCSAPKLSHAVANATMVTSSVSPGLRRLKKSAKDAKGAKNAKGFFGFRAGGRFSVNCRASLCMLRESTLPKHVRKRRNPLLAFLGALGALAANPNATARHFAARCLARR